MKLVVLTRSVVFIFAVSSLLVISNSAVNAQTGWSSKQSGLPGKDLNAVYFADSKHGWIAGDDGFVSHTEDGGITWVQQDSKTDDAINDIYFRNKENGYILAGGRILVTTDGGREWRESVQFQEKDFDGASPELYSIRFGSKKRGWVVGSISRDDKVVDSLVLYTNDSGASWQRQTIPTKSELIHIDFVNDERGWIVGSQGTVLFTDNAGDSWRIQKTNTVSTLYHVDFADKKNGWAVGDKGTIIRTGDGGETWVLVDSRVLSTLLSVKFVNDTEGWAVGRRGMILRSVDGGLTWAQQDSKTTKNVYALVFDKKKGWAVGADGMVFQYER